MILWRIIKWIDRRCREVLDKYDLTWEDQQW